MDKYQGGKYDGLVYTISHPKTDRLNIPQGKRVNARAQVVNWIVKAFDKFGMKIATKKHLEPLGAKIKTAADKGKVVLVVLQLIQWETKNGAGDLGQMLHYAYIGGIADSRHLAFNIHKNNQRQPLLKLAPPRGWVYGDEVYLWFENEEKRQEQSQHDHGNLNWDVVI